MCCSVDRRTELIGNKTVTRKHLLELLDATGSFGEAEEVTGRAETTVEFLGMEVTLAVSLAFKAGTCEIIARRRVEFCFSHKV